MAFFQAFVQCFDDVIHHLVLMAIASLTQELVFAVQDILSSFSGAVPTDATTGQH